MYPRVGGGVVLCLLGHCFEGCIPARAGRTFREAGRWSKRRVYPRARGKGRACADRDAFDAGLSPRGERSTKRLFVPLQGQRVSG